MMALFSPILSPFFANTDQFLGYESFLYSGSNLPFSEKGSILWDHLEENKKNIVWTLYFGIDWQVKFQKYPMALHNTNCQRANKYLECSLKIFHWISQECFLWGYDFSKNLWDSYEFIWILNNLWCPRAGFDEGTKRQIWNISMR